MGRQTRCKEKTGTLLLTKSGKHTMRVPGDLRSPFEQLSTNRRVYPLSPRKGSDKKTFRSDRVWYSTDESWILLFAHVKFYLNLFFNPIPIPPLLTVHVLLKLK